MAGQEPGEAAAPYLTAREGGQPDVWTSSGPEHTQRLVAVSETVPPSDVAALLDVAVDKTAVVRRRIMYLSGKPVELTDSWYPAAIAAGTALAEHRKIKGGAVTVLAELGHVIAEAHDDVTATRLAPDLATELGLDAGRPVLVVTRVSRDGSGRPIEVGVMHMLAGQHLSYHTRVS